MGETLNVLLHLALGDVWNLVRLPPGCEVVGRHVERIPDLLHRLLELHEDLRTLGAAGLLSPLSVGLLPWLTSELRLLLIGLHINPGFLHREQTLDTRVQLLLKVGDSPWRADRHHARGAPAAVPLISLLRVLGRPSLLIGRLLAGVDAELLVFGLDLRVQGRVYLFAASEFLVHKGIEVAVRGLAGVSSLPLVQQQQVRARGLFVWLNLHAPF